MNNYLMFFIYFLSKNNNDMLLLKFININHVLEIIQPDFTTRKI